MANRKSINPAWLLIPAVMGIFIFAAFQWLSTSDSYTDPSGVTHSITGLEVVHSMHPAFFTWVWTGLIGTFIFGTLAYLNETGAWIGKYLKGDMGITILFIFMALACLIAPWIPAFTAKVDGGQFTQPETKTSSLYGQPTSQCVALSGTDTMYYGPDFCDYYANGVLSQGRSLTQWYEGRPETEKQLASMGWTPSRSVWSNCWTCLWMGVDPAHQQCHVAFVRWMREYFRVKPGVVLYRDYSAAG